MYNTKKKIQKKLNPLAPSLPPVGLLEGYIYILSPDQMKFGGVYVRPVYYRIAQSLTKQI